MNTIMWSRLKEISKNIVGKNVEIFATTEMLHQRAVVRSTPEMVEIILNLAYSKTPGQVIKSLAHELSHVLLGSDQHTNEFRLKWKSLESVITEKYNR